ncbi:MAG: group II intron maturase-specific domain-containing protein [Dehalobacterium sp.]
MVPQCLNGFASWKLHLWNTKTLEELAQWCNPVIRGWFNYYGSYRRLSLARVNRQLDLHQAK